VWLFLHFVQERFYEVFEKPKLGWRLIPFLPHLITLPAMFVPGPWKGGHDGASIGQLLLLGVVLGFMAYNFGGIANRFGLGKLLDLMGFGKLIEMTERRPLEEAKQRIDPPTSA
jgi:hypothetical protein